MTSAYTNIPKPTGTNYTNVSRNITDYPQYGVAVYGVSRYGVGNMYTSVAKPTGSSYTKVIKPTT